MSGRFVFDPNFSEAIFHRKGGHRVAGKTLLPYSTWHRVQLEHGNSPFLAGGDVTVGDVEFAVGVCRTRYPDFFLYDPPLRGWRKWMALWRAERVDVPRAQRDFAVYFADYASGPKMWESPKKKGEKPARRDVDDSISDVAFYVASYRCPVAEAWNLPVGELRWMNVCAAKQAGADVRVWTPADERAFREHLAVREQTLDRLAAEFSEKENLSPAEAKKHAHAHYWATVKRNKAKAGF